MAKRKNKQPKVFVSYSWTSPRHRAQVREWAELLIGDGVDVVIDAFDLKEGHDKYAFMERMVTDSSVTHVLVVCDKMYAEKADLRKAGVGTESQIISKEVYDKVEQSKFIPIVCEFAEDGEPYLPAFLKSRVWLDFSSPESANQNWEGLIRLLYGKPLLEKPALGKPPAYISTAGETPASPLISKFNALRQAILLGKPGLAVYRRDFLDASVEYADALRVRKEPDAEILGEKVVEDCGKLVHVRNRIVDWILLESEAAPSSDFDDSLLQFMERLRGLKSRPPEVNAWVDAWDPSRSLWKSVASTWR
ncbi:MAG: TIR domain-containing protein [Rubricoccaceae bacterium]|nr:TIR domain-containing protein [Rubricoccaceae bacterium]